MIQEPLLLLLVIHLQGLRIVSFEKPHLLNALHQIPLQLRFGLLLELELGDEGRKELQVKNELFSGDSRQHTDHGIKSVPPLDPEDHSGVLVSLSLRNGVQQMKPDDISSFHFWVLEGLHDFSPLFFLKHDFVEESVVRNIRGRRDDGRPDNVWVAPNGVSLLGGEGPREGVGFVVGHVLHSV